MGRIRELFRSRPIFSWALYDWANSVFATTVIAGFFPVFFKQYWSTGADAVTSTAQLGFANSIGSVFILIAAPILGAVADGGASRKKFLGAFTALGVAASAGLWFVGQGDWSTAAVVYVLASIGFSGALVFYDALIMAVSPPARYDEVSAFGYSLGYIGGGLLFADQRGDDPFAGHVRTGRGGGSGAPLLRDGRGMVARHSPSRCSVTCRSRPGSTPPPPGPRPGSARW